MSNKVINVIVAGLGGQGVLKASDIIADVVFRAGFDVKKSEVHGMSQRGGSVRSDIRFGERVFSPMVPDGEADYLVALDATQVEVHKAALKPGGVVITPQLLTEELPNKRSLNVAMSGALSAHLDIDAGVWLDAVRASLPEKLHEMNERAFATGREAAGCTNRDIGGE